MRALQVGVAHDRVADARSVGRTASTKRALPPGVFRSYGPGVRGRSGSRRSAAAVRTSSRQQVGRLADDLVGILAVGQADDPDLVELDAGVGRWPPSWPMSALSAVDAERAGLLARRRRRRRRGRSASRSASASATWPGRQGRPERGDDVVEAGLVGHQRVRVALDDDRLAALPDRALGPVDEVQRPALVEQRRGRRVEVLRPVVAAVRPLGRLPGRGSGRRARPRRRSGPGSGR